MSNPLMHLIRISLISLLVLTLGLNALGQIGVSDRINQENDRAPSLQALETAALKEVARGDDYQAMKIYHLYLDADPLNTRILRAYGDAAIRYSAFDSAAVVFQRLIDNKMTAPDGAPFLRLAGVKYQLGDYVAARDLYRQFLFDENPVDATGAMKLEAERRLGDCEWALDIMRHPVVPPELFMLLDSGVNTPAHSEHSPYLFVDTLYFSSSRFTFQKDKVFPKRSLNKVMTVEGDNFSENLKESPINEAARHTTHTTVSPAGDVLYYTNCDYVGTTVDIRCEIYLRRKLEDGSWGPAEKLPEQINMPGFTNTQPSIGPVPGEDYAMLYFVSNRPGGQGQKDIWCSKVKGSTYSVPMNVTSLNTSGNDVTPFYHAPSKTFYYSTDSLQTLGGLDVYKSSWNGESWSEPVNMGSPINSGSNDAYYVLNNAGDMAFMATNRRGEFNQSEEGCCYDLYEVDYITPKMKAITFWKKDGVKTDKILPYTTMTLIEVGNPNATPIRVDVEETGEHEFELLPGKTYMLIGEKKRFSSDTLRFTTPAKVWREPLVKKLYMEPNTPLLVATVYDALTKEPILGATAKFFDLGEKKSDGTFIKGTGIPQIDSHQDNNRYEYPLDFEHRYQVVASKQGYTVDSSEVVSTEGMVGTQTIEVKLFIRRGVNFIAFTTDKLSGDTLYGVTYRFLELPAERQLDRSVSKQGESYTNILDFDKRYRIIATKEKYSTDSLEFSTANLPKVDFQTIIRELRLRSLELHKYLPIPLYFDNDEPDKRTLARTTKKEYRDAFVSYIVRKDTFISIYTEGSTGQKLINETDSLEFFFEKQVRGGWNRLMEFSEVLFDMLTNGDSIVITLKGYASPRAGALYNKNLTDRRVTSVYNHFDQFDGGIYKQFVDSKQLVILREANGEAKAPAGVSDDIKDVRKSVYDVGASRERRLEIIGVKVNKGSDPDLTIQKDNR